MKLPRHNGSRPFTNVIPVGVNVLPGGPGSQSARTIVVQIEKSQADTPNYVDCSYCEELQIMVHSKTRIGVLQVQVEFKAAIYEVAKSKC